MHCRHFILFAFLLSISQFSISQDRGILTGRILDCSDNSGLYASSVFIEGTTNGVSTDRDGRYKLTNLPEGKIVIVYRYLGYLTQQKELTIISGQSIVQDIELCIDAVMTEEVVIRAQAMGQMAAINQQINSNTIVNVVSKEKIQELPDQNAAESIGRLAGISIQRNAGEGTKVIVRGLSPRFNSITINGERIPSTDEENRSVDLSMISTDALEGIEVFKALRPDMDADAVGGTINFVTKKADEDFHGNVRLQGGYNNLESDFGQFRGSMNLSNRFFDNKLGVIVGGNFQRANRGSDNLNGSYRNNGIDATGEPLVRVNNLSLVDRVETRDRFGTSLTVDYKLKNGGITFNGFSGNTIRDEVRRRRRYRANTARQEYDLRDREINTRLFTSSLNGKHDLKKNIELTWQISHAETNRNTPFSHTGQFRELGAFPNSDETSFEAFANSARNDLEATFLKRTFLDVTNLKDLNRTASINLQIPVRTGKKINGNIKFGGKIRDKERNRDNTRNSTGEFGVNDIGAANPDLFDLTRESKIKISNFIGNYVAEDFLKGQFYLGPGVGNTNGPGLDEGLINQFRLDFLNEYEIDESVDLSDYIAGETIAAGYFQAEANIGKKLMLLAGVRHEHTSNDYSSIFGSPRIDETGNVNLTGLNDTTGTRSYSEILPMVHARYKFFDWFDLRLAATKTLARPNYFNLVPWERLNSFNQSIEQGRPDLKHTTVWNYDAFLSFYNKWGLFTLGGFYKELKNIDYIRQSRNQKFGPTRGWNLTRPENSKFITKVKGVEMDLQLNMRFLPSPFDGIVLSANYTLLDTETFFPLFLTSNSPDPPFLPIVKDTVRLGRLPGQANRIGNLAIGYEKGGFSGRISMVFQGKSLRATESTDETIGSLQTTVGIIAENDNFTNSNTRWDISIRQNISETLSLFMNINNFTNAPDRAFRGSEKYPTQNEVFGWTSDIGLRWNM
jgi:TonB-dependent receptor